MPTQHLTRLEKTLAITPPGGAADRILEMGVYLQITPALKTRLGYGEVRGCYYGPAGQVAAPHRLAQRRGIQLRRRSVRRRKRSISLRRRIFLDRAVLRAAGTSHRGSDAHDGRDQSHFEAGRPLLLTTPNIGSLRAIAAILQGYHPGFFPAYIRPPTAGVRAGAASQSRIHCRGEIAHLLDDSGFEITLLETGPFLARAEARA